VGMTRSAPLMVQVCPSLMLARRLSSLAHPVDSTFVMSFVFLVLLAIYCLFVSLLMIMIFFVSSICFIFSLRTESRGRFYLEVGSTRACMHWRRRRPRRSSVVCVCRLLIGMRTLVIQRLSI
jgi:hypothetical protein